MLVDYDLPSGTFEVSETWCLGDATPSQHSSAVAPRLIGAGSGGTGPSAPGSPARTRLLWTGPVGGGPVVKINGPVHGARVAHLVIDGNGGRASSLLETVRAHQSGVEDVVLTGWSGGFALSVHHGDAADFGPIGGAGYNTNSVYRQVLIDGGVGTAHGLELGRGVNINNVVFERCGIIRSGADGISLQLGNADHCFFDGCLLGVLDSQAGRAVLVKTRPLADGLFDTDNQFPANIVLRDSPLIGGVDLDESAAPYLLNPQRIPALHLLPAFTMDGQPVPPVSASGGLLPVSLVAGVTDRGDVLGINAPQVIRRDSAPVAGTDLNTPFDLTLLLPKGAIWEPGSVCEISFSGVYSSAAPSEITWSVEVGGVTMAAFRVQAEVGPNRPFSGSIRFIVTAPGPLGGGAGLAIGGTATASCYNPTPNSTAGNYVPPVFSLSTVTENVIRIYHKWWTPHPGNSAILQTISASASRPRLGAG